MFIFDKVFNETNNTWLVYAIQCKEDDSVERILVKDNLLTEPTFSDPL